MKHKLAIAAVSAALLSALAGCQLAIPSLSTPASTLEFQDDLVGIFAATSPIPNDPIEQIYGTAAQSGSYSFDGLDGFYLLAMRMPDATDGFDSVGFYADDSITDVAGTTTTTNDTDTNRTLTGTLHVSAGHFEFYAYAIRQDADGRVYITGAGQGIAFDGDASAVTTQSMSDSKTITTNGKSVTNSMSITFNVKAEPKPSNIVLIDMDVNNAVLSRTEYAPGTVPSSITPKSGTAYIIVETHTVDDNGTADVLRAIYSPKDPTLHIYADRWDGILIEHITDINW